MSGQNSEVNRVIDDTAEGHVRQVLLGEGDTDKVAGRRAAKGVARVEDAETEGHKAFRAHEAEELRARRTAAIDDAETEGHVFKK